MMHSTRAAYTKGSAMERVAETKQSTGSPAAFVSFPSRIGNLWKDDLHTCLSHGWIANCQGNGNTFISLCSVTPEAALSSLD